MSYLNEVDEMMHNFGFLIIIALNSKLALRLARNIMLTIVRKAWIETIRFFGFWTSF